MDVTWLRKVAALFALVMCLTGNTATAQQDGDRRATAALEEAIELERQEKSEQARELLAKLEMTLIEELKSRPKDTLRWLGLARLQANDKRYYNAGESVTVAAQLEPKNPKVIAFQGVVLSKQDEFSAANSKFQQAIELSPRDIDIRLEYAQSLAAQDRNAEAELQAREAVKLDAQNVWAVQTWAFMLYRVGKSEEATGTLTAALELKPKDHGMRELLALLYWGSRMPAQAYAQRLEIRKQFPELIENEAKMIFLATQAKDAKSANEHIARLRELLTKKGRVEESFARDEYFFSANCRVIVEEFFEPAGELGLKYSFHLADQQEKPLGEIELGSIPAITEKLKRDGKLKDTGKAWCLWRRQGEESNTYAIYLVEPTYEEVRAAAVEILEGRLRAFGSASQTPQASQAATPSGGPAKR